MSRAHPNPIVAEAYTRRLEQARDTGDDPDLRNRIREGYKSRCDGREPYDWQLNATEAVMRGIDTTVVAGTGAGKSEPFIMPTLAGSTRTTVIISPLKNLEEDQQSRFEKLNIKVVVVNADTMKNQPRLKEMIVKGKPEVVLASPEISLSEGGAFREILGNPEFTKNIGMYVVDEAHCITQQGKDFRPFYRELDKLRALAPHDVPILAVSATMPMHVLADVREVLCIDARDSYHINLGNDRPNVAQEVRIMANRRDYAALDYLVEGVKQCDDLIRTIVYVRTIYDVHKVLERLRGRLPANMARYIDILHSRRSERDRRDIVKSYKSGEIKILIATESAGMGLDIADVVRIVQLDVPDDLNQWVQRMGRAGRSRRICGEATMIVPKSSFEIKGGNNQGKQEDGNENRQDSEVEGELSGEEPEDDEDEDLGDHGATDGEVQYRKKIEGNVRAWLVTTGCRRDILDEYYDNPPRSRICCDNCKRALDKRAEDIASAFARVSETPLSPSRLVNSPRKRLRDDPSVTPSKRRRSSYTGSDVPLPALSTKPKIPRRGGKHLADAKQHLNEWRRREKRESYPFVPFMSSGILPDRNLKSIASRKDLTGCDDLNVLRPSWPLARVDGLGEQALEVLANVDERDVLRRQTEAADRERGRNKKKVEKRQLAEHENAQRWEEEAKQRASEISENLIKAFRDTHSARASALPATASASNSHPPASPSTRTGPPSPSILASDHSNTRRYRTRAVTRKGG